MLESTKELGYNNYPGSVLRQKVCYVCIPIDNRDYIKNHNALETKVHDVTKLVHFQWEAIHIMNYN